MKLIQKTHNSYAEEHQVNGLRWAIVKPTEEGFETQSSWLKCKDFFNDWVFTYHTGKAFTIYGFGCQGMELPKAGENMFLAVKALNTHFRENLKMLAVHLDDDLLYHSDIDDVVILELSPRHLKNTYYISLLTLVIRLLNYGVEFKSFDELVKYDKFPGGDAGKWGTVVKKGWFFNLPKEGEDYLWYYNNDQNSKKMPDVHAGLIHNCGVVAWSQVFS